MIQYSFNYCTLSYVVNDKTKAGLYLESTILENPNYYNNLKTTKAIAL